jgi:hypothetical protein
MSDNKEISASIDDVLAALRSELAYQRIAWGDVESSNTKGVGGYRTLDEYALYIQGYANDLAHIASHESDPKNKLDFVRKVMTLCVSAMLQHGAPLREISSDDKTADVKK